MTDQTTEVLPEKKAIIPVGHRGVEMRSLNDFYRFAQFVMAAGMAPPGITNEAGIVIALQRGAEVGLLPMQALQSIYIVNNQPNLYGDAPLGIVEASGLLEDFREVYEGTYPNDDFKAVCITKRVGRKERRTEFSIADAKTAELWGKKSREGKPGPWVKHPKRMLQFRARGYALRDDFSDVLKGFPIRELSDEDSEEVRSTRAKPAKVFEPQFSDQSDEPASPPQPPPSPGAAQGSLFSPGAEKPAQRSPVAKPKSGATGPLGEVKALLKEGKHSEEDLLMLLAFTKTVQVDTGEIVMGRYDLSNVPTEILTEVVGEWNNVSKALEAKPWKNS